MKPADIQTGATVRLSAEACRRYALPPGPYTVLEIVPRAGYTVPYIRLADFPAGWNTFRPSDLRPA